MTEYKFQEKINQILDEATMLITRKQDEFLTMYSKALAIIQPIPPIQDWVNYQMVDDVIQNMVKEYGISLEFEDELVRSAENRIINQLELDFSLNLEDCGCLVVPYKNNKMIIIKDEWNENIANVIANEDINGFVKEVIGSEYNDDGYLTINPQIVAEWMLNAEIDAIDAELYDFDSSEDRYNFDELSEEVKEGLDSNLDELLKHGLANDYFDDIDYYVNQFKEGLADVEECYHTIGCDDNFVIEEIDLMFKEDYGV